MSVPVSDRIERDVPLAPRTTLELGGNARFFVRARSDGDVLDALIWAQQQSVPATVLAGGSNLVVADAGFDGLVIDLRTRGIVQQRSDRGVEITAAAGEPWDGFVEYAVSLGLAGIECLSGIPGRVGATPIQNVGAYGQEVADTIRLVRLLEPSTGLIYTLGASDCGFAYRDSRFKHEPARFMVLDVTFELVPGPPSPPRYAELQKALAGVTQPSLHEVREMVIALRRAKSMVIDANDENRRSAGSFFTNPIVTDAQLFDVTERALSAGVIKDRNEVPTYPASPGHVKLAAGWLVERAGFHKGMRRGAVGVSSRHALSLVHHGGGTTQQLIDLAREIVAGVQSRFGVMLKPEPVCLGFAIPPL